MVNEGLKALKRMTKDHGIYEDYGPEQFEKDYKIVENMLKANDVLRIIFNAPFILERLFELGKLGEDAKQRYMWGTISAEDVEKVKEFFADGKRN